MKLYEYFRSSASYRVRIALNFKAVEYESIAVDLRAPASAQRTPQFLGVNPEGMVPVLVDGERTFTQSLAIIEYLEELRPQPPLLPRAPRERAQVRALALAIACDIHPLNNLRVLNYLREPLHADETAVNRWYAHWIAQGFTALEAQVKNTSGDGRCMFGKSVTLADVCLVPQMANAQRMKCDVEPYPTLRSICAHLEALPPFAKAAPAAHPKPQPQ
jgi:maleylpyruvate isomerase